MALGMGNGFQPRLKRLSRVEDYSGISLWSGSGRDRQRSRTGHLFNVQDLATLPGSILLCWISGFLVPEFVIPAWIAVIKTPWEVRSSPSAALDTGFPAGMTNPPGIKPAFPKG